MITKELELIFPGGGPHIQHLDLGLILVDGSHPEDLVGEEVVEVCKLSVVGL